MLGHMPSSYFVASMIPVRISPNDTLRDKVMKKLSVLFLVMSTFIGAANAEQSDELQNDGSWFYKSKVNKLTDSTDVVAINSSKDIYVKQGTERSTSLVLRCNENSTDAYLSVTDYLGVDSPQVTIRYDGGKPQKITWTPGEGGDSAFAPNAVLFIKELSKHKKLVIGFEPYGSTMQIVEFDLAGIDNIAKKISDACNWKI